MQSNIIDFVNILVLDLGILNLLKSLLPNNLAIFSHKGLVCSTVFLFAFQAHGNGMIIRRYLNERECK